MAPDYEGHPERIPPWCPIPDKEWLQELRDLSQKNEHLLIRIEAQLTKMNGTVRDHDRAVQMLLFERGAWLWVVRAVVITTPIAVFVANWWFGGR